MEPTLREAAQIYNRGEWHECLQALGAIASTESNHMDLAYLLGLTHARLEHNDEALLFLEQIVTSSEDMMRIFQCRFALALIYARTSRYRLAEYELNRLLEAGYQSAQVLALMGYASWSQGNAEDAIKWYQEAFQIDSESPTILNGLGYVLACEGKDAAKALTYCRKAVDINPDNAAYLDSLAWAYFRMGFIDEAKLYVGRALGLAPREVDIAEHARLIAGAP